MAADTRDKILTAAARLFAAPDAGAASLRAIARAAGVNSALIHYHFGSREGLFEAVILEALRPVQERRGAMIEALQAKGQPSAEDLARLFVEPLLASTTEDSERHAIDLRLLARSFSEHRPLAQDLMLKHFGPLMYSLGNLLGEALPDLPTDLKHRRMRFCVQAALETIAGYEMEAANAAGPAAREALVAELVGFLAGGLKAPIKIT
jgi:AcrR family transcriptional regulator